jgi:hypothetical protein
LEVAPSQYLRLALETSTVDWLPIRYFASAGKLSTNDVLKLIENSKASTKRKDLFKRRVKENDLALTTASGAAATIRAALELGLPLKAIDSTKAANDTARAVQGLSRKALTKLPALLDILNQCLNATDDNGITHVRRAICRVDELHFNFAKDDDVKVERIPRLRAMLRRRQNTQT